MSNCLSAASIFFFFLNTSFQLDALHGFTTLSKTEQPNNDKGNNTSHACDMLYSNNCLRSIIFILSKNVSQCSQTEMSQWLSCCKTS